MIIAISDKKIITEVKLNGGKYNLRRDSDGIGDSGTMLNCIDVNNGMVEAQGEIRVGYCVQCGSHYARSYSQQDWWMTTPVTEILFVNEDKTEVKFKTRNSYYTVRAF